MRRRFHTYLMVTLTLLGGGWASAWIAEGTVAASSGQHRASTQASAATRIRFTNTLVGYLRRKGFQVNPGYPMLYPKDASICATYAYPAARDCFANNPTAPYVMPVLKSWPNEYVDPATVNMLGPTRRGYGVTYRLGPREAIVIYGQMPPPGRYMGVQTIEFSQQGRWKAKDYHAWANRPGRPLAMQYLFNTIPPNDRKSGRVITASALGDIVNNVVMQRRSGAPWGKNRYFIITPSATTDRAVRRALRAQGVPDSYIFTEQIPSRDSHGPIGPLGMGKNAIDFNTTLRYAIPGPGYGEAAAQWRRNLPLTVLRVRAPAEAQGAPAFTAAVPVDRYGALTYEPHTSHSELYLAGDVQNLIAAVCSRTSSTLQLKSTGCGQPPPPSSVLQEMVQLGWVGPYCREINMNCNVDNADAAVYLGQPFPLDSGEVYAVVGTLATQTGNATYTALSVNDASKLAGVSNTLDTTLKGSADGYAATVNNTDKFYVHYFTRNCAPLTNLLGDRPADCTPITPQLVPTSGDTSAPGHPALKGMFIPSVRDYIVPGTERGPDSSKLLNPRILTFAKP